MKKELKQFPFEVKEFNEESMTFKGYAAVFNNVDYVGEVILPGAFKKSLQIRPSVILQWRHSFIRDLENLPVGKTVAMWEDEHGLWIEGKLSKTTMGLDLYQLILDKVVTEMSVGFHTLQDGWEKSIRYLKEIDLMEVSLVDFAANPKAKIMSVKGATTFADLSLADADKAWDASAAKKRVAKWAGGDDIDWKKYAKAFFWFDSENKETLGAYKLPFADIAGGELQAVPKGVMAAAGAIQGARGGVDIPEGDVGKVKSHIAKYYKKMDKEVPWAGKSLDFTANFMMGELEGRPMRMFGALCQSLDESFREINAEAISGAVESFGSEMQNWLTEIQSMGLDSNEDFMRNVRVSVPYFGSVANYDEGMKSLVADIMGKIENIKSKKIEEEVDV